MNKDYDEEIEYGEKGRTKHTTFINFKISEIVENGFYGIDVDKKESIFTSEILFLQCKYLGDEKNRIKYKKGDILKIIIYLIKSGD